MRLFLIYFISFVVIVPFQSLHAELYHYHPSSRLYLGGGHNPFYPTKAYLPCVDYDEEVFVDTQGAVSTNVEVSLVKSRQDLYRMINFETSLAGSYFFYNGNGEVKYENEQAFHSDSLTWIILFKANFGRSVLKNPRPKVELTRLDENELYMRCGPEIVIEQQKGALVYALLTITNLTESKRRELESKFSARAKGSFWNAQMDVKYKSLIRSALSVSDFSLKFHAIGGPGPHTLVDLVGGDDENSFFQYEKIPDILRQYLSQLTRQQAVPIRYSTANLSAFIPSLPLRFHQFKKAKISSLYNMYTDISSAVSRMRQILYGNDSFLYDLSDQHKDELFTDLELYEDALESIYKSAQSCFSPENYECQLPDINLRPIHWPKNLNFQRNICEEKRMKALDLKLIDFDLLDLARKREMVPLLELNANGKWEILEWNKC